MSVTDDNARRTGAITLLSRMLAGISATSAPHGEHEADFSASTIATWGETGIYATIHMPSGDTYRVVCEWVPEDSP